MVPVWLRTAERVAKFGHIVKDIIMKMFRFSSAYVPVFAATLVAAPLALVPASSASAQIGIGVGVGVGVGLGVGLHVTIAPPMLPVYEQPPLPAPGYIWTPGYWAYGDAGYYWVPGTWVEPPQPGLLWTPGYWGWNNGVYAFNGGYWGPHVGFYGGINYGFGYTGTGFFGGSWRGGVFAYNRSVNNFGGVHVTNVYNQTVINNNTHVAFNGPNGINARPTPQEAAFAQERHIQPTENQMRHVQMAAANPQLRAAVNHGAPAIAATQRPAEFKGPGVVPARAAAEATRPGEAARPGAAARPGEAARSGEAARPGAAAAHPAAEARPAAASHAGAEARPASAAEHRPAASARTQERVDSRVRARTEAPHAAAPHEAAARPAAHAAAAPRPAARPAPRPAPHPAARPAGREEHHG
jgi:hypothetical protein